VTVLGEVGGVDGDADIEGVEPAAGPLGHGDECGECCLIAGGRVADASWVANATIPVSDIYYVYERMFVLSSTNHDSCDASRWSWWRPRESPRSREGNTTGHATQDRNLSMGADRPQTVIWAATVPEHRQRSW